MVKSVLDSLSTSVLKASVLEQGKGEKYKEKAKLPTMLLTPRGDRELNENFKEIPQPVIADYLKIKHFESCMSKYQQAFKKVTVQDVLEPCFLSMVV